MKSILLAVLFCLVSMPSARAELRAGAAKVDVTPPLLPVIRNGGFLEATDNKISDPLHARCLVLDDRVTRLAIVVVDSCMVPMDLCDEAKRLASDKTGIPVDRIQGHSSGRVEHAPRHINGTCSRRHQPPMLNNLVRGAGAGASASRLVRTGTSGRPSCRATCWPGSRWAPWPCRRP